MVRQRGQNSPNLVFKADYKEREQRCFKVNASTEASRPETSE